MCMYVERLNVEKDWRAMFIAASCELKLAQRFQNFTLSGTDLHVHTIFSKPLKEHHHNIFCIHFSLKSHSKTEFLLFQLKNVTIIWNFINTTDKKKLMPIHGKYYFYHT